MRHARDAPTEAEYAPYYAVVHRGSPTVRLFETLEEQPAVLRALVALQDEDRAGPAGRAGQVESQGHAEPRHRCRARVRAPAAVVRPRARGRSAIVRSGSLGAHGRRAAALARRPAATSSTAMRQVDVDAAAKACPRPPRADRAWRTAIRSRCAPSRGSSPVTPSTTSTTPRAPRVVMGRAPSRRDGPPSIHARHQPRPHLALIGPIGVAVHGDRPRSSNGTAATR